MTTRPLVLAMQLVIRYECSDSEMLDRLTTIIVDQYTDSVDLSAMGYLKNWHSFFRDKSTVRQHSL